MHGSWNTVDPKEEGLTGSSIKWTVIFSKRGVLEEFKGRGKTKD
jgi:hypothetical protein